MKKITALLLLLLGSHLFAQEAIISLDQASSTSVFTDVGGGVKVSTVNVVSNLQAVTFVIAFQSGNPTVEFVTPAGLTLALDSPRVQVFRTDWGLMAGVITPEIGTWTLKLSQTLGESSYQVKVITVPGVPTAQLLTPGFSQEPWSDKAEILGKTQPDQAGKTVRILVQDAGQGGMVAGETLVKPDGTFRYLLDASEFSMGEYHVSAALDGGDGPSVSAEAPGSLYRTRPARLSAISEFVALAEQPNTLQVAFKNPFGRRSVTFRAYVSDAAGVEKVIDLGNQTEARLTGFEPGSVRVWVLGVDSEGQEGFSSAVKTVEFGAPVVQTPRLALAVLPPVPLDLSEGQAVASFVLTGGLGTYSPSAALLETEVGTVPNGLNISPVRPQWTLPADAGQLQLRISATPDLVPGTYSVPVTFRTVGVPQNTVTGTLEIRVFRPEPAITSVSPDEWNLEDRPTLLVMGQNFLTGTRVYLDGAELPIKGLKARELSLEVPAGLTSGAHNLVVSNPDGVNASASVTVRNPNYVLLAIKTVSKVVPGASTRYWVGAKAINGFTGTARLTVSSPPGWTATVDPSVLSDEVIGVVSVQVPSSALPGDYTLNVTTDEGGKVELKATVVTTAPEPFLSSMAPFAEIAGGTVALFGYGFGDQAGTIAVDGQTWLSESWSDNMITLKVPAQGKSGLLRVKTVAGRLSNGITFGVKDYGFQFHTNQVDYQLQGGESVSVDVQLTGYQQAVDLTAYALSSQVQVGLLPRSVTPTGLTRLTLAVDKNIPIGTYPVTLKGTSGLFKTELVVNVVVGQALVFVNAALPSALMGTNYGAQLATANAQGATTFSLSSGVLPRGIVLSSKGQLSGRALEAGLFRVVLQVQDASGHTTTKEFALVVDESGWGWPGRDESQSWSSPVDSPADGRSLWNTAPVPGQPLQLLAGGNNFFLQSAQSLAALYAPKGNLLYQIPGALTQVVYNQGQLLGVDGQGFLRVWEAGFGNEVWNRDHVTRYWPKAGVVLVEAEGRVSVIDSTLGTLTSTVETDLAGILVGWKGDLYRLQGRTLQFWSDASGWSTIFQDPSADLTAASGDGSALIVRNSQNLVRSWDGTQMRTLWTGPVRNLSIAPDWLAVDTGLITEIRDRNGQLVRVWAGGGYDQLLSAREKLFSVKGGLVSALNLYTGAVIWQAPAVKALLAGDRLVAADASGRVTVYNAPNDLKAPVTKLSTVPELNGANGWFVTKPQVTLTATDAETYAASTVWKVDAEAWAPYAGRVLNDGVHSLAWRSIDPEGLTEADNLASLKVDTVAPTTSSSTSIGPLSGTIFGAPVNLSLSASDATSGLAALRYRLDGGAWLGYTSPLSFSEQRSYTVDFQAQDQAGNWEAVQTKAFWLDYQDPTVSASLENGDQARFVYLSGADAGTGLDRLEYRIDGGDIRVYASVVAFVSTGTWTLTYRAVDRAGRTSAWKTLTVSNTGPNATNQVGQISYNAAVKGREIENSVRVGSRIFVQATETFLSLPPELDGAYYLRHRDTDGQLSVTDLVTVKFTGAAKVYYLKEPASKASMTGWTAGGVIATGVLNKKYFPQGFQIYTRDVVGGQSLVIPGSGLTRVGGDLVFIQGRWFGTEIVKPLEDATVTVGQPTVFEVYTDPQAVVTWTGKWGNGNWSSLGVGNPITATLPLDAAGKYLEVRADAVLGTQRAPTQQTMFELAYPEKLVIASPTDKRWVRAGKSFWPVVLTRDKKGQLNRAKGLTFEVWSGTNRVYQGSGPIPGLSAGTYRLKASSASLSAETTFTAAAKAPRWLYWSRDLAEKFWKDEDGDGIWGDQRSDREDRDGDQDGRHSPWNITKWNPSSEYRWALEPGRYRISAVVGPLSAWEVHSLWAGTQAVNVMGRQSGQLVKVDLVVDVGEADLVLKGTSGIPLWAVSVEPVENSTPLGTKIEQPLKSLEDWK